MSTDTLEHDLAQYLANDGYEVTFQQFASNPGNFTCYVIYGGAIIADRDFFCSIFGTPGSYPKAARWALRIIEKHRKAMRMLGGVVRT